MSLLESRGRLLIDVIRQQPEFAVFRNTPVRFGAAETGFAVGPDGAAVLGEAAFEELAVYVRLALETAYLVGRGLGVTRAVLAAARAAALFAMQDTDAVQAAGMPAWVALMAQDAVPPAKTLAGISSGLIGAVANAGDIGAIRDVWGLLGTAEALMETGGDIRLQTDPHSALNGYGCSHRPRPWAVTFASSTASSSSERGYEGADRERLRVTLAMLRRGRRETVRQSLGRVRAGIAGAFELPADTAVILAASGTDAELLALALTHLARPEMPILNILIAPEETGRGVPMAARGRHFAVDTALGHDVNFEASIAGFRRDTALVAVALRNTDGAVRDCAEIEAEIYALLAAGIAAGQRVILHGLDLSKTGLLAPSLAFFGELRAVFGARFDIVVDACQTRLSACSIKNYLALDAVVLITGSKFFTGPPFAGAALVPGAVAARLAGGRLPQGLDAYFGRDEFPDICPAAACLPDIGNYGLALRWHAALAEMRAFGRVSAARKAETISAFGAAVAREVAASPRLDMLPQPGLVRGPDAEAWEILPSIFSFSLKATHEPGRCLTPAEARAVYFWLNTDLSPWLPQAGEVARRICHIGQPVKLPQANSQPGADDVQGMLRISAGARLISGEPSHKGLGFHNRLRREIDDLAVVFKKIDLILHNWALLSAANPVPRYRPGSMAGHAAHENVIR